MRQMEERGQSKGVRLIGQVVIFVLILVPLLLSCGGGDDDPLTVDAGPDQNVGTGSLVTLDGSKSTGINPDTIVFKWSFASVPPGSALTNADLADADTATPTFTPDVDGAYVLRLKVDYGIYSGADSITVTAWTTFEKTFGGASDDGGYSVQQTADGGFIVTGYTTSYGAGSYDVYLVKTDFSGNVEWEKTYGGGGLDIGYSGQQTLDGGFIVAGSSDSGVYLIKTDSSGNVEWEKAYGGSYGGWGFSVRQTTDGGFVIAGAINSFSGSGYDVYLVKTDASGNLEWEETYGGTGYDEGRFVQQTSDGGFVVAGSMGSDVYLIKTDSSGTVEWEKTYGGASGARGFAILQTTDGGFIVVGDTSSSGAGWNDVYLIKTDSSGNLEWEKTYGDPGEEFGSSVQQTVDGGFVIAGGHGSSPGNFDAYLVKTDSLGGLEWEKTYGGSSDDYGLSIQQTADGGFVVAGGTLSYGVGDTDVYLIKTDSMGNVY